MPTVSNWLPLRRSKWVRSRIFGHSVTTRWWQIWRDFTISASCNALYCTVACSESWSLWGRLANKPYRWMPGDVTRQQCIFIMTCKTRYEDTGHKSLARSCHVTRHVNKHISNNWTWQDILWPASQRDSQLIENSCHVTGLLRLRTYSSRLFSHDNATSVATVVDWLQVSFATRITHFQINY